MAQDQEKPEPEDAESPNSLSWWQRTLAAVVGVAMTGAGGYSVFKTSNQAGSSTLLIFGCIFMISSLNGAQIQGLKLKDADVQWQRTKIRRKLAEVAEQEPPETARQILDALNTADPQAARDPIVQHASGAVYEREVFGALDRLASPGTVSAAFLGGRDYGADFVLDTTAGRIAVIVNYRSTGRIAFPDLMVPVMRAAEVGYAGMVIVTNGRLRPGSEESPAMASMEAAVHAKIVMVRWIDQQDDEALKSAISELMSRIQDEESV
jgi:hypothetical protein